MTDPLVSVIVPIYNIESYLDVALDSLYQQCTKEIEVILINDGSTDSSINIAREWCGRLTNLATVITIEHSGISMARNIGLRRATGEFIYFMDGDDQLVPGSLTLMYSICKANKLDILQCRHLEFISGEENEKCLNQAIMSNNSYIATIEEQLIMDGRSLFEKQWRDGTYAVPVWRCMYNREFLIDNHIDFEEGIFFEDHLFSFEVMLLAQRAMAIHEIVYCRRTRKGSVSDLMQIELFRSAMRTTINRIERILESERPTGYKDAAIEYLDYLRHQLSNCEDFCNK